MFKKIIFLFVFAAMLLGFGVNAFCENIDTDRKASLKIDYKYDKTSVAGAQISIYRAADVSSAGVYSPAEGFEDIPVDYYSINEDGGRGLASTLIGYAAKEGMAPTASALTSDSGEAVFSGLKTGLYAVKVSDTVQGGYTYKAEPFIALLPSKADGIWNYDISAAPKTEREGGDNPPPKTVDIKVLKVWDDEGSEDKRPESIEVVLMGEGKDEKSVTLNEENNWRYEWTGLSGNVNWTVMEKSVPENYTVNITKEGITFVVRNTYKKPDGPSDNDTDHEETTSETGTETSTETVTKPNNTPSGGGGRRSHRTETTEAAEVTELTTEEKEKSREDVPLTANETNEINSENQNDEEVTAPDYEQEQPEAAEENTSQGSSEEQKILPQTGLLRLPVPFMLVGGAILFLFGYMKNRRSDK